MSDEVDRLEIAVDVAAKNANRSLNTLEKRINRIADGLQRLIPMTSSIDGFGKINMSGLEKAQEQIREIVDSEKRASKQKVKPRVDRTDLKYTEKSLDDIYEKFKDVGKNADFSNLGLKDLEAGLRQSETAAKRLNERLEKKVSIEGTSRLGKQFESLVYDIQKATNQAEMYREAISKIKRSTPEFTITRGKNQNIGTGDIPQRVSYVSPESLNYDPDAMRMVFGEGAEDLRNFHDVMQRFGKNASAAGRAINEFEGEIHPEKVSTYEARIKELRRELAELASQGFKQGDIEYDEVAQQLARVTAEKKKYDKAMRDTANAEVGIKKTDNNLKSIRKNLGQASNALSKFGKSASKAFGNALIQAKRLATAILGIRKQSNRGMSFGRMLGFSIAFSFVFQGISAIQNAVKEGTENLAQYSAEYNQSISSIVSSLLYLKNAWAVAFAPIVNVVAPYLSAFIDMIASALNSVGQFMAALTGKGFVVQAKKAWKDYAASLGDVSSGADDAKDAMKDLQSYTLGIDELNVIQPQNDSSAGNGSGGGGADGTEISPSEMFDTIEVSGAVSDFAKQLREAFLAEDWEGLGQILASGVNSGLQKLYDVINWNNVGPKITKFVNAFTTTFNSFVDNINWTLMGNTVGAGINTIVNTANLFITGIDWTNLGVSFGNGIMGIVNEVNWTNLGTLLGNKFMIAWRLFLGVVTTLEWSKIGLSLANGLNGILESIDPEVIGGGLSAFGIGVLAMLSEFFSNADWEAIGRTIVDGLKAVDWKGLASGLWNAGTELLGGLLDAFGELPLPVQIAAGAVAAFFGAFKLTSLVTGLIDLLSGAGGLIGILKSLASMFGGPVTLAIMGVIAAGALIIANWDDIKVAAKKVGEWIADKFEKAYGAVTDTWKFVTSWWKEKFDGIKRIVTDVKDSIVGGFKKAYKGVQDAFSGIGNFFKGIANKAIAPIGKLVNGIIDGINWVSNKLGVGDVLDNWGVPQFAKGSGGIQRDTFGVVNDQKGGTYKEMIMPPNGKPFIPRGRNVMLPLQKGTKIMPADQTKEFMRMSKIPHFAGGIGDFFGGLWDSAKDIAGTVWDYMTHPDKILQIAINKFVDMAGLFEPWLSVAGGIVNKVFDSAVSFIKGLFDKATPEVSYNPSAGVEQWRALATKALQMTGQFSDSNLNLLLMQMDSESNGNPNAINNWDVNAQRGTPSKGLMQVIDPTFKTWAMDGYDTNIWDPLSNMLAAIRYTVNRYGSLANGWKGHGYASGIGTITMKDLVRNIPKMADGGVLSKGQIFMARERGPELVGSYGSRSVVMNNDQIVKSVSVGVGNAVDAAVALILNKMEEMQEVQEQIRDKKTDANIDGKRADKLMSKARKNTGYSFTPA